MSKMVSLLADRGWLVREEDPVDRRRKLLSLTPDGIVAHKRVYEAVRDSVALSLDPLDGGQRAQVVAALDLLLSALS
jgi:DNA-binding MarR family transcriptional regulator